LETLLAEVRLSSATFGSLPIMVEVDFYVVPSVSMRLKALAYCNKHGLWESDEVFVRVMEG
jgi:superoxide reductase